MYIIESRNERDPTWSTSGIGDNNLFTTDADARSMVEELKTLGGDWATAEYRVLEAQLFCDCWHDDLFGELADNTCQQATCGCRCRCD